MVRPEYQRPYFSNFSDLLQQYGRIEMKPTLHVAQRLDRHVSYIKGHERKPITIKNCLKMPYFFIPFQGPETKNIDFKHYTLEYDALPPSCEEIRKEVIPE